MELVCEVKRVLYRNDSTNWGVFACEDSASGNQVKVVGSSVAREGQQITAIGEWVIGQKGDREFHADNIRVELPTSVEGLQRFLASGVLPGVGKGLAQRMVDALGDQLLDVLNNEPAKLVAVPGISQELASRISKNWQSYKVENELVVFLASKGVSTGLAKTIMRELGEDAVAKINKNPYRLTEIRGIGFKKADAVARAMDVALDDPARIKAGIQYLLDSVTTKGHCGLEIHKLVSEAAQLLEVDSTKVDQALIDQINLKKSSVIMSGLNVYPASLAHAEDQIAEYLLSRLDRPVPAPKRLDELIEEVQVEVGFKLKGRQREAVEMALTKGVSILSGGPGCGKTSTLRVILACFQKMGLSIAVAAPTGKAAQRAAEATGMEAQTLHRLMRLTGKHTEPHQIAADVLVIDEASMVDVPLMSLTCQALTYKTRLLIVGDADQLASVGPGNVLRDMILSGEIPYVILDQIFRQAEGSLIIRNIHSVNRGERPSDNTTHRDDFWFMSERNTPALQKAEDMEGAIANVVERCVTQRITERRGIEPQDIWVLTPTNKGPCGVRALNHRLQHQLNPNPSAHIMMKGMRFGVGDRVIQKSNCYDLDIFNGDVGVIESIESNDCLMIRFESKDELTAVPVEMAGDLDLAYAMTIHKSQGSQAKAVVIPLVRQHTVLLQRNLLYTGLSRAQELAVLIVEEAALERTLKNNEAAHRVTRLCELLKG